MLRKFSGLFLTSLFIFSFALAPLAQAQIVTITDLQAQIAALQQQLSTLIAAQQSTTVTTSATVSPNQSLLPAGYTEVYTEHNYNKTWHVFYSPSGRTWITKKTDDKTGNTDWTHTPVSTVGDLGNSNNCSLIDTESNRTGCIGTAVAGSIQALTANYPLAKTSPTPEKLVFTVPVVSSVGATYFIEYDPTQTTWLSVKQQNGRATWTHPNLTASGLYNECNFIYSDTNIAQGNAVAINNCAYSSVLGAYNVTNTVTTNPNAAPTISSISPNTAAPGGQVTITGLGSTGSSFLQGTYVLIDGVQSVNPISQSSNTLIFVIPYNGSVALGSHTIKIGEKAGNVSTTSLNLNVASGEVLTPTVNITVSPTTITSGQTSTLSMSQTGGTSCTLNGQNVNLSSGTSGTSTVAPAVTTTYTLTCSNSSGSNSANATVTVNPPIVTVLPTPTVTLSANPTLITAGQSSTLTWSSNGATSCSLNVSPSAGGYSTNQVGLNGSVSIGPLNPITPTTLFTLTCANSAGQTTVANTTVSVSRPNPSDPTVTLSAPTVTLTANPTSITAGQSSILYMSSVPASSGTTCVLTNNTNSSNNGQNINFQGFPNGTTGVSPTQTTTYTLTCTNSAGSNSASALVTVNSVGGGGGSSNTDPYTGANYSQTSSTPLSSAEKTVNYTYPSSPCGSLMTSYATPGSVSPGNGPVYASAVSACSPNTPNTSTFRTYSCSNSSQNGIIVGTATFAFQCASPSQSNVFSALQQILQQLSARIAH